MDADILRSARTKSTYEDDVTENLYIRDAQNARCERATALRPFRSQAVLHFLKKMSQIAYKN